MEQHGFWTVTKEGYFYPVEQSERPNDWVLIKNQLGIMATEGTVEWQKDGFLLPHEHAVQLAEDLRALLELPDFFPFEISIQSKGSIGRPSFQYIYHFIRPDGQPFIGIRSIGSYVEFDDYKDGTYYMFNEDQYHLLELMDSANQESQKIIDQVKLNTFNTLQLAKVKEIAKKIHATMDRFIKQQKIVTADKLSVRLQKNSDGSYSVFPVILKKSGASYTRIPSDSLDDIFLQNVNIHKFIGHDHIKYVFTNEQAEGIKQIRDCQHISEKQAQKISECPKEIFDSDAFTFDLGVFGERVVSIGKYEVPYLPCSFSSGIDWLPPEGSSPAIGMEDLPSENIDKLKPLIKEHCSDIVRKIGEAQAEGKNHIVLESGEIIKLTPDFLVMVDQINEKLESPGVTTFSTEDGEQDEKVEDNGEAANDTDADVKKIDPSLIIKNNYFEMKYQIPPQEKWRNKNLQPYLGKGLRKGISPFSYQMDGMEQIALCWKYGFHGVLLADDMGLGKTMQAFGFLAALKKSMQGKELDSVLIVAPVSLLRNWETEYEKFMEPDLFESIVALYGNKLKEYRTRNVDGTFSVYKPQNIKFKDIAKIDFDHYQLRKNKIILTTYETLRDFQISFGEVSWSVMIIDEAQKIKNPGTRVSNAVRAMNCDFGLALTGTPVENTWNDLWTIMDFVQPGKLNTLKEFNKKYQKPLERAEDKSKVVIDLGTKLRKKLDPCFIRRLKEEVNLPLPPKNIQKFKDPMQDDQKKMYGDIVKSARKDDGTIGSMLTIIGQLRDISLCPNLSVYNEKAFNSIDPEHFFATSARLMRVKKILDDIEKKQEKVIIFVESRKLQLLLETFLERMYGVYVPAPINGTTEASERQKIVDRFNEEEGFQILILSPLAAGVGLNITGANHVIHLSRCWNPAKEDQATDRVYRIGQKKEVTVYIPMAYDPDFPEDASFDLNLDALLDHKRELGKSALYPTDITPQNWSAMFQKMTNSDGDKRNPFTQWTINDTDKITGSVFEVIVSNLYRNMGQYQVTKTKDSGDKGADVIARSVDGEAPNLLIQCKQTSVGKSCDGKGVQEVQASLSYYKKLFKCDFKGVVITNSAHFTNTAITLANANGVQLIGRNGLAKMLEEYPVKRNVGLV